MSRKVAAACMIGLLVAGSSFGASLSFYNTNPVDPVTGDGNSGVAQAGWVVAAFKETGGGGGYQFGADTLYASTTLINAGGNLLYYYGGTADTLVGNETVYVIMFNQSSIPGLGDVFWYANAVNNPFAMTGQPADVFSSGGDGTWMLVPEPSTLALSALGIMVLAVGRKLRK